MSEAGVAIKFKDLIEGGATFDIDTKVNFSSSEEEEDEEVREAMKNFKNLGCEGKFDELFDEDSYTQGQPFKSLAIKMTDVDEQGAVKKKVLRAGYGNKAADLSQVTIHYNAYVEFEAVPFDSTYARRKPHKFVVNNGEVVIGLDIAVQTMQINEKSQFLVKPEFAYGTLGCLGRVPANAIILYEIELIEIVESGAALAFKDLPQEKQNEFEEVYKYALALCSKGKDYFSSNNVKSAIKEYNTAVHKLEMCHLNDYASQEKQVELLIRLYTNLLVCFTKEEEPRKGCTNFNKLFREVKNGGGELTAKIYYNHAKCLKMLGEFTRAKTQLQQAKSLEPDNTVIANEILQLENDIRLYKKKETEMAKSIMGNRT